MVIGLLLIELMLQPLTGSGLLLTKGPAVPSLRLSDALPVEDRGMLDLYEVEQQAERLIEKGSGIMREHLVNQTNRQLSSLLSLFPGVKDAQVAAQMGASGLQRVVVHLYMAEEAASREHGSGSSPVEPVAPVLIMGQQTPIPREESEMYSGYSLTSRVKELVADFYGIEPEAVIVNIAGCRGDALCSWISGANGGRGKSPKGAVSP